MSKLPALNINLADLPYDDALALAKEAENAGFQSTSVPEFIRDSLTYLAAMAVATDRIQLVSNVATWTRTPVNMARACRDVDLISKGRLVLGLGSMPGVWNRDFHGIDPQRPASRMREYVELLRLLWASDQNTPVDYEGEFYQVRGYRMFEPPPRPHLPIMIGASRPGMLRTAGEIADGVLFNWNFTLDFLRDVARPAIAEGAAKSGRTLDDLWLDAGRPIVFTDDKERAEEAVRWWRYAAAAIFMGIDYHQELLIQHGFEEEVTAARAAIAANDFEGVVAAVSDEMADTFLIRGSPEECLERVAEFDGLVDSFFLWSTTVALTGADKVKETRRLIEIFGDAL